MTKEESAARRNYRRAFAKALTAAAKKTPFRTANGCLYEVRGEWFIAVGIALYPDRTSTRLAAHVKPMAIDPIFWDAMELSDEWRRPLWKRHLGLAVRDPPFADILMEDAGQADEAPARILQHAEAWASSASSLTLEDYLCRCRSAEKRPFHYFAAIATTLVAIRRRDEALQLCRAAIAAGEGGGYRANKRSFADRMAELVERI